MNYQEFNQYISDMAEEIFKECKGDMDTAHDLSFERANDSEYVIYYSKAWDLCDYFRFNHHDDYLEAEYLVEELGGFGNYKSVDDLKCVMASCIVLDALREELDTIAQQNEEVA